MERNQFHCPCLSCPRLRQLLFPGGGIKVIRFMLSYSPGGGLHVQRFNYDTNNRDLPIWEKGTPGNSEDAIVTGETQAVHPVQPK